VVVGVGWIFWGTLGSALAVAATPLDASAHNALRSSSGWVADRTDEGVDISWKTMPGTQLTAWRAVAVLEPGLSADQFLTVLIDTPYHARMSDDMVESVPVREEQGALLYYQVLDLPAPLSDRYWIAYAQTSRNYGGPGHHFRQWSSAPESAAADVRSALQTKYPRGVEVTHTHGQWEVETLADGRLQVTLRSVVDPGGAVPSRLAGVVSGKGVADNIRRMEEHARKRAGSSGG
jgi:hypothetical protein